MTKEELEKRNTVLESENKNLKDFESYIKKQLGIALKMKAKEVSRYDNNVYGDLSLNEITWESIFTRIGSVMRNERGSQMEDDIKNLTDKLRFLDESILEMKSEKQLN